MKSIVIIGYGVIGHHMQETFPDAAIIDPELGFHADEHEDACVHYDVGFICVPTPEHSNGSCDTRIVEQAILEHEHRCSVLVIKSTVPPGSTRNWYHENGYKNVIMSPEFSSATQHGVNTDQNFVILGGRERLTSQVAEAYKEVKDASFRIFKTTHQTAELVKYMDNSFLAMKVTFCNEFYRMAKKFGVDYDKLREAFLLDPRINPSHTFVYRDKPYYDSHCWNKDLPAIREAAKKKGYTSMLLNDIIWQNSEWRIENEHGRS